MAIAIAAGFLTALISPMLCRRLELTAGWVIALAPLGIFSYFLDSFGTILDGNVLLERYRWAPQLDIDLSFRLDGLSFLFALLISGIGLLIVLYTGSYLAEHRGRGRFFASLLGFMASMLGLVLADNLLVLYLFWELTSVTSYLLIGFEHERSESRAAALQALLVTFVGGLALLAGIVLLGIAGDTFELSLLLERGSQIKQHDLYIPILCLVLLGAFTKSAQFPLHFWLPNAMAAPTPASAYLHSSTMVKAGVYLVARLTPVLGGTDVWRITLTLVGGLTMLVGAWLALRETHLKRVLAYSTIGALGVMVMLVGIGTELAMKAGVVFLLAHALYKAPLFLVAGSIDHETGTSDIEKLGGLARKMPLTAAAAAMAGLSMAGVIPLVGFLGKELLFEAAWHAPLYHVSTTVAAVLASIAFVTVAALVAVKPFFSASIETPKHPHEAPLAMWLGPALLAIAGLAAGMFPDRIARSLVEPAMSASLAVPVEAKLELWHGLTLPLILSIAAVAAGVGLYVVWQPWRRLMAKLDGIVERGPDFWYSLSLKGMNAAARGQTRLLQNGYLRYYLLTIVVTVVLLVGYALFVRGGGPAGFDDWSNVYMHEVGVGVVILVGAAAAVHSRSLLGAVAALGVVGVGVGMVFVFFGAPDLAITQFVIETLTVILFVLEFYYLKRFEPLSTPPAKTFDAIVALAAGGLMTMLVLTASTVQWFPSISEYFNTESVPQAHGRNIVNVILVDFRSIDTLGEITVLAAAALGVFGLLKIRPRRGREGPP